MTAIANKVISEVIKSKEAEKLIFLNPF